LQNVTLLCLQAIHAWADVSQMDPYVLVSVVARDLEVEPEHGHRHHGAMLPVLAAAEQLQAAEVLGQTINRFITSDPPRLRTGATVMVVMLKCLFAALLYYASS
jgi:hypothetical protein